MESHGGNCVGCERLARRAAALEERVARLLTDNERLCGELAAAAKKNSSTSSKPPSSDVVKPDAKGVCRVSHEKLREFFSDVLNLSISTGQLVKLATALDAAYDELQAAHPSQTQVGSDETGHKENGRKMWTWRFQTPSPDGFALYTIDASRGSAVLEAVLGDRFIGTLSCDFFSAYRKFQKTANLSVQYCWAHLIRDVRFLTTLSDKVTKNYGERLLTHIGRLFHDWHRRADRSVAAADNRLARRRAELLAAAKRPLLARKPKTSPTAFGATPTIIFDS